MFSTNSNNLPPNQNNPTTQSNSVPPTQSRVSETVSMINVYYESFYYVLIEERPLYTFSTLLGTIGLIF